MDLKNKRVFITGAARRLGKQIALHLLKAGCDVTIHYNHSSQDAEAFRSDCRVFQADFSAILITELKKRIDAELGAFDILINNASSFQRSPWNEVNEQLWDHEFAVNLKVPFFLSQHLGHQMKQQGFGKIINMADIAAFRSYLNYLPYSLAKSGLVAMTKALARALAPQVQVNAIAPGTILFPDDMSREDQERVLAKIPAHRTGTLQELLHVVDFLLSDVDYMSGQIITLDGGRSL